MPSLSGIDKVEFDQGATGSYDFTFSDIHDDTDLTTELYENDEDVRGDNYFTGSTVDGELVLPDLTDDTSTDQTSTLITMMTSDDYHKVRLTKYDGTTIVLEQTKVRVMQNTNSSVGNLDSWSIQFRDVDTSGIFYWN